MTFPDALALLASLALALFAASGLDKRQRKKAPAILGRRGLPSWPVGEQRAARRDANSLERAAFLRKGKVANGLPLRWNVKRDALETKVKLLRIGPAKINENHVNIRALFKHVARVNRRNHFILAQCKVIASGVFFVQGKTRKKAIYIGRGHVRFLFQRQRDFLRGGDITPESIAHALIILRQAATLFKFINRRMKAMQHNMRFVVGHFPITHLITSHGLISFVASRIIAERC